MPARWTLIAALLLLAVLGAATIVVGALGVTTWWIVGSAALLVAVASPLYKLVEPIVNRSIERREARAIQLDDGCLVLAKGRPPRMSELSDPVRLGVHSAIPLAETVHYSGNSLHGRVPAYIERDVDNEVRAGLSPGTFLLLVGDSTAGKSRTAYEAARRMYPRHLVLAPDGRAALDTALSVAPTTKNCVLWLENLENFVGAARFTRNGLSRVLAAGGSKLIVATLRAVEEARLTEEAVIEDDDSSSRRQIREVLQLANRIYVPRMFSSDELARAQGSSDPRIEEALRFAGEYGVAEFLAAGPQLVRDWEDGWAPGHHPRGAALVTAAAEIRKAGNVSPLNRTIIECLHERYLRQRGGERLRPELLSEAWEWATRDRSGTAALLDPHHPGGEVRIFDYLADAFQANASDRTPVHEDVVREIVSSSRLDDAQSVVEQAYAEGRYRLAEDLWRTVCARSTSERGPESVSTLQCRYNLGLSLRALGRLEDALDELRNICALQERVLGPEDPQTLTTKSVSVPVLRDLGCMDEAESVNLEVLDVRRRALGADHKDTLTSRSIQGTLLRNVGRYGEAEIVHRKVLEDRIRVLGSDHTDTLVSLGNLAIAIQRLGKLEEAERLHRRVLDVRVRTLGSNHPRTLLSRSNVASLLRRRGRPTEAAEEHRYVLNIREELLGPGHHKTLTSRTNLGIALRDSGHLEEAEKQLRSALVAREDRHGQLHRRTLVSRHYLASVLHRSGRLEEAEVEYLETVRGRRKVLGPKHPDTVESEAALDQVQVERNLREEGR